MKYGHFLSLQTHSLKSLAKPGLTLHGFCRTTDQIRYDMTQRVIAEDRGLVDTSDLADELLACRLYDCIYAGAMFVII